MSTAISASSPSSPRAQQAPAANAVFNSYTQSVERRLAAEHASPGFLTPLSAGQLRSLHGGQVLVEALNTGTAVTRSPSLEDAMLYHWRGLAFLPHAHAAAFDHLLRDLPDYPAHFAPEVLRAAVLTTNTTGDHMETALRLREHHVLTVTLDTAYDLTLARPTPIRGFSTARSTRITEIANPDTAAEHPLTPADAHGFLLRLNTYWTWEERPDGLYLQIETVSLSRAIPTGLTWALRPYVNAIPRDSLAFTLNAVRSALSSPHP